MFEISVQRGSRKNAKKRRCKCPGLVKKASLCRTMKNNVDETGGGASRKKWKKDFAKPKLHDTIAMRKLLSIQETADYLGISITTLYTWVCKRKIPFVKVGKLVKFEDRDLNKWIAKRRVTTADNITVTQTQTETE